MLDELLTHLRNWFVRDIHAGTYTIETGLLEPLPFLMNGQYFRIVGSVLNDGVYQYGDDTLLLEDETFTGEIWALVIPKPLLALAKEIEDWQAKNGAKAAGPYQSESFGGYTYTMKADSGEGGGAASWQGAFAKRLNKWRKL